MSCAFSASLQAQNIADSNKLGTWNDYSLRKKFGESGFGINTVLLYRSWDYGTDLEQFIIRAGATYKPKKANIVFSVGYDYVTNGEFGESSATSYENRLYQQVVLPQKVGDRFYFGHRLRYEQRWVQGQDFRTRYRYRLALNFPLNKKKLVKGTVYLRLFNELFVNGERDIGEGRTVPYFDRNWYHAGLGYVFTDNFRIQAGFMRHITNSWNKTQSLLSLLHRL